MDRFHFISILYHIQIVKSMVVKKMWLMSEEVCIVL